MAEIIKMNDYKKKHGIALPRSPYSTLKASKKDLDEALEHARNIMEKPFDYRGQTPYAVVVGYENKKTGDIKLLKDYRVFSSKNVFEQSAGIRGHYSLGLVAESE